MKFFNDKNLGRPWAAYTFAICSGVVLFLALSHIGIFFKALHTLGQYAFPVFLGFVIAYVLNPLTDIFEEKVFGRMRSGSLKRTLSIMLSFVSVLVFLVLLIVLLVPQVIGSVSRLVGNMDTYSRALQRLIAQISASATNWNIDLSSVEEAIRSALQAFTRTIPASLQRVMSTSLHIGRTVFYVVIACIMAAYFLTEKEKILAAFKRLLIAILPDRAYRRSIVFLKKCNRIMSRYIIFDLLDGLIVGVANWIFMMVTGMSYAVLISVVVGVTNLAPTFGPIVGAVIGGLILVLVNPWHALFFLIFTIVLQTIDGYYIKPKLFGDQLGISGIWILICIIIGGRMFGATGVLFSIPFAAIADFAYKNEILARLELNKIRRQHAGAARASAHTAKDAAARGQLTSEIGSSGEESEV